MSGLREGKLTRSGLAVFKDIVDLWTGTALHEPKNFRAIMLSSTFTDLKEHRQRMIEAINKLGYMPRVMEHSGAQAATDVIDTSLAMVRESAAYVGVISLKYGQTPRDPVRNPDQLSITELEFNEATRLGRPIVLFIMGEEHPVKKVDVESEPEKRENLDAFRERAKLMRRNSEVQRVYETFESLEQFSHAAAIAIGNLIQHLDRSAPPRETEESRTPRALSNIPFNLPRYFLGRDDDLAAIDSALKDSGGLAAITALHGLRGVGKTILAAAYAERHRGDYRATWWIRAETESTMRADLVGLGVQLGWVAADATEEPALATVLERLRLEGEDILLVYDNANNSQALRPFLPRSGVARIIVTSNAPNWSGIAVTLAIRVWPKEIGADYLHARTNRDGERDAALTLSEALGGLPLAHEQAAAYCERLGISFVDYLRRFEAMPAKLLNAEKDAPVEYHDQTTVAKTFALAIAEAAKLHPAAEQLILYAALLAPEPIPLFLFTEAGIKFGKPFALLLADDGLDEAVAALRAFALVDRETVPDERDPSIKTDCIRLHRLVRQVAGAPGGDESLNSEREMLVQALAAVYPERVFKDPETWPRARRLDALALPLVNIGGALSEVSGASNYLLSLLAAYRHGPLAAYALARSLYERVLAVNEIAFGPDHATTATCLNNLGMLLTRQGDFVRARQHLERALSIQEQVRGHNHPSTAPSLNNLGSVLEAQGDYQGAHIYFERALAIRENDSDADELDTAVSLNNFGVILHKQGDLAAARPYLERALAIREKELSDHPDTAVSLINLGYLLRREGDLVGARKHYERSLSIREKTYGPDHPETANSLNNLGYLSEALGDPAGARSHYERALTICDAVFGTNHPLTQLCARNTIGVLGTLGRTDEATVLRKKHHITA